MAVADNKLPTISILMPTLNAAKVLGVCLESVKLQDYPKSKLEIVVADGGSTDDTRTIAKKYGAKIYANPLKTGEAGKAVALRQAKNELVALIDSDNILPARDWLRRMVEPFGDSEIIGCEPWDFTYRQNDGFIDRYCALMGMNDPFCYFLGNYDRKNVLSGRWTELPVKEEDKGSWMKVTLEAGRIPTIGANGIIFRRCHLLGGGTSTDYLFDIDIIANLSAQRPIKFAKVKMGIIHLFCGSDIHKFIRKQKRRVKDYLFYQKAGLRRYHWQGLGKLGLLKFILSCITIVPLVYQSLWGYTKKPDPAWFFHPLACWITLYIYTIGFIKGTFQTQEMNRDGWKQ